MSLTLTELKDRLKARLDPDELVDILDISSEELVEMFSDKVEEKQGRLEREFSDEV